MARRLAMCGGLLGGVLEPSMLGPAVDQQLKALLRLADRHGLAVDLHIDEADHAPAQGVKQLLRALQITPVSGADQLQSCQQPFAAASGSVATAW